MRTDLIGDDIETLIAGLESDLKELKSPQFTSQNSGLIGRICRADSYDSFGDIVDWHTSSNPTIQQLSHIPCPATASSAIFNTIECETQIFVPQHAKPAVAVPFIRLEVKSGGLHGLSEFVVLNGGIFRIQMYIYNASNVKVGEMFIMQHLGEYLRPAYDPLYDYAWFTSMSYTCSQSFELSYKLIVRSSDRGVTSSQLLGIW